MRPFIPSTLLSAYGVSCWVTYVSSSWWEGGGNVLIGLFSSPHFFPVGLSVSSDELSSYGSLGSDGRWYPENPL